MKVNLPEGQIGDYVVRRFTISEEDAKWASVRAMVNGHGRGVVKPGEYTGLWRGNTLVMSDTPDEQRDHRRPVYYARGVCRVHGLGIGMVVAAMLEKPEVERVEVVEISDEVLQLVTPTLMARYGDRFSFVQDDVLARKPIAIERGYTVIWHDIWDNITPDNLPEMALLHRRWARRTQWQGSWAREECYDAKRRWGG